MLVLKRGIARDASTPELGSQVTIEHAGETLTFTLIEVIGGNAARVGFEGPSSFVILRDDVGRATDARLGK